MLTPSATKCLGKSNSTSYENSCECINPAVYLWCKTYFEHHESTHGEGAEHRQETIHWHRVKGHCVTVVHYLLWASWEHPWWRGWTPSGNNTPTPGQRSLWCSTYFEHHESAHGEGAEHRQETIHRHRVKGHCGAVLTLSIMRAPMVKGLNTVRKQYTDTGSKLQDKNTIHYQVVMLQSGGKHFPPISALCTRKGLFVCLLIA